MLNSEVTIPVAHNNDVVSVALVQEGAVEIAYGIRYLLCGVADRAAPGAHRGTLSRSARRDPKWEAPSSRRWMMWSSGKGSSEMEQLGVDRFLPPNNLFQRRSGDFSALHSDQNAALAFDQMINRPRAKTGR